MRSSDLLTRAVSDVESLQDLFIRAVAPPLVAAMVAAGAGAVLGAYAFELAMAFVVAFAATAVMVPLGVLRLGAAVGARLTGARAELAVVVADGLQGMADLLAFGQGSRRQRLVDEISLLTFRTP